MEIRGSPSEPHAFRFKLRLVLSNISGARSPITSVIRAGKKMTFLHPATTRALALGGGFALLLGF